MLFFPTLGHTQKMSIKCKNNGGRGRIGCGGDGDVSILHSSTTTKIAANIRMTRKRFCHIKAFHFFHFSFLSNTTEHQICEVSAPNVKNSCNKIKTVAVVELFFALLRNYKTGFDFVFDVKYVNAWQMCACLDFDHKIPKIARRALDIPQKNTHIHTNHMRYL